MRKIDLSENSVEKQPVDEKETVSQNHDSLEKIELKPLNLKPTENKTMSKSKKKTMMISGLIAILLGVATGYGGYRLRAKSAPNSPAPLQQVAQEGQIKAGDVFGITDDSTFKDSAEGYLEEGGVNGDGSHSLLRAGGESQTVVLTSSVTDLDKFIGMNVKVWGETFKAQTAGWLMDVGKVEVVNPEGIAPTPE